MKHLITVKFGNRNGRFTAVIRAEGQKTQRYTYGTEEEMLERLHNALHVAADIMLQGKITAIRMKGAYVPERAGLAPAA